ncbi:MAG TPA: wax ester/triacylglycerol synthase family O-acyltransferase [Burkholderiaceae bacterium]|nr:wax ester/triacylglycerol synthase family O-acyltransferase [Burkholderiaceae bacterium]
MDQLSAHDAGFLYSDTTHSNSNVSLLHIYDQSTVAGGRLRFKTLLAHIEGRLDRSPVFRRRLQRVPFGLDHPYWVADTSFDLEYHVRHIALPKPGDWRQFCIQVSRIHARPLDLNRPLWEIYVIEGLDSFLDLPAGSFALLTKTHHAAIDPAGGSELTALLHDTSATPPAAAPPAPWLAAAPPGSAAMLWRGAFNMLASPLRLARPLSRALVRWAPGAFMLAADGARRQAEVPPTRFNSVVSPHRVFETRRFALDDFKRIRGLARDATVNDAVLAVCGGALRRYLAAEGELPDASLTALTPYLARRDGRRADPRAGLAWLQVQLGTQIADPAGRLAFIRAQTAASGSEARAVAAQELTDIEAHIPAATLALASKMLGLASRGIGRRRALATCSIANVPGPDVPLYLCGARMTYFSAMMPIADGMGLAFAVTSYDGQIIVSPTSCRELMPDPERFAQCLRESFQEALEAATRQPDRHRSRAAKAGAAAARREHAAAKAPRAVRSAPPRASASGRRPPKSLRA